MVYEIQHGDKAWWYASTTNIQDKNINNAYRADSIKSYLVTSKSYQEDVHPRWGLRYIVHALSNLGFHILYLL